jgi:hypothetical protein
MDWHVSAPGLVASECLTCVRQVAWAPNICRAVELLRRGIRLNIGAHCTLFRPSADQRRGPRQCADARRGPGSHEGQTIKSRVPDLGNPVLTCGFLSRRQDLNLRPLDPQSRLGRTNSWELTALVGLAAVPARLPRPPAICSPACHDHHGACHLALRIDHPADSEWRGNPRRCANWATNQGRAEVHASVPGTRSCEHGTAASPTSRIGHERGWGAWPPCRGKGRGARRACSVPNNHRSIPAVQPVLTHGSSGPSRSREARLPSSRRPPASSALEPASGRSTSTPVRFTRLATPRDAWQTRNVPKRSVVWRRRSRSRPPRSTPLQTTSGWGIL